MERFLRGCTLCYKRGRTLCNVFIAFFPRRGNINACTSIITSFRKRGARETVVFFLFENGTPNLTKFPATSFLAFFFAWTYRFRILFPVYFVAMWHTILPLNSVYLCKRVPNFLIIFPASSTFKGSSSSASRPRGKNQLAESTGLMLVASAY